MTFCRRHFQIHFLERKHHIFIPISLKFVLKGPTEKRSAMVPVMAWGRTGGNRWGRVTHIRGCKLTIIGSDNGLSPDMRQAFIWTDAKILLIGPLGTNVSEIFIEIHTFSFKKMHLKNSFWKWRPFCLGLNVLTNDDSVHLRIYTPVNLRGIQSD